MAKQKKTLLTVVTPEQRALEHLCNIPETELHTTVILPLLSVMASHVEYVHGREEEGKDFVYMTKDPYGEDVLEVCQVKNSPFNGNSGSSSNMVSVLTQVMACKQLEITNPITHKKQLPQSVTLFSTYDLPQRLTRSATPLLEHFDNKQCRFIGPDKLLQLLQTHLPRLYDTISHSAQGLGKAILVYVDKHHEAIAFGLRENRLLHTFFVDVALQANIDLGRNSKTTIGDDVILESSYKDIINYQSLLPKSASAPCILKVGPVQKQKGASYVYPVLDSNVETISAQVSRQLSSASSLKNEALHLLTSWSSFLTFALPLFPETTRLKFRTQEQLKNYHIHDLEPSSLIERKEAFCITGEAGAGKTSLARAITRAGFDQGRTCTYFPCYFHRKKGSSLLHSIIDFLHTLSEDLTEEIAKRHILASSLIVIDGCDEAYNFDKGFNNDLRCLLDSLHTNRISTIEINELYSSIVVPSNLDSVFIVQNMSVTKKDNPKCRITCVPPIRNIDFNRFLSLNPSIASSILLLQKNYEEKACQVVLTSRSAIELGISDTWHKLSLTPFSDEQLEVFFEKWFSDDAHSLAEIKVFLKNHQHIREVCRRPIVASLLAALRQNGCDLPHSKTELYTQRFDLLLEDWDRSKNVPKRNKVRKNDKMALLTRLALYLHSRHRREFTKTDIAEIWNDAIQDLYPDISVDDLLAELRLSNGVIIKATANTYTLGHLSYQEYLAAQAILNTQKETILLQRFQVPQWREVLIFYCGLRGDISSLLYKLQRTRGLDRNAGLLDEMVAEARFTKPVVRDFVRDLGADADFLIDSAGIEPFSGDDFDEFIAHDDAEIEDEGFIDEKSLSSAARRYRDRR